MRKRRLLKHLVRGNVSWLYCCVQYSGLSLFNANKSLGRCLFEFCPALFKGIYDALAVRSVLGGPEHHRFLWKILEYCWCFSTDVFVLLLEHSEIGLGIGPMNLNRFKFLERVLSTHHNVLLLCKQFPKAYISVKMNRYDHRMIGQKI